MRRAMVARARRASRQEESSSMAKHRTPMNQKAASRIQAHADTSGTNAGFKARAMSTAAAKASTPSAPARTTPSNPLKK